MKIENEALIKLKTFLGTLSSVDNVDKREDYWKLIGEIGTVIDDTEIVNGRVMVLFKRNLDELGLENHNSIPNSLWIRLSDLETKTVIPS